MPRKAQFDFDLIVIGSGAAGSPAATIAAHRGMSVAIVEADTFGGESPNFGDVPTKALLHAAQLFDESKRGSRFGLRSSTISYNYLALKAWKDTVIKRTGVSNNRRYYEKQNISTFSGRAHFLTPNEISVNRRHLSAKYFVIATGSTWKMPSIVGLKDVSYLRPKDLLDLNRPPKSLFIVGGDSEAIELAQLVAIYGTKVYIAEKASRLLPSEDEEAGLLIEETLQKNYDATILTQSRVLVVEKDGLGKRVRYTRGGVEKVIHVDDVLVTVGRQPAVDLGLENASVEYTPTGVSVNEYLQTSSRHIFAAGDVLGENKPVHTGLMESRIIAHNLFAKNKTKPDYVAIPRVTHTMPGVASVGLTEDDCLKRDLPIKKSIAPLNMTARSNTSDFRDGFVKLITDKNGVLLGATVVAPHAGEIIHELTLAVRHNMTASQVASTPHAFLSWSEAVRVAATRIG